MPPEEEKVPGKPEEGHSAVRFTETHEEAKAKIEEAKATEGQPNAEQLKVDQASFDKFYNKETQAFNWEAYAREQEFKLANKKPDEPAKPSEAPKHTDTPSESDAQDAVSKAGLDWDKLGEQLQTTGDISAEDRAALKALSIPDTVIDGYIENVKQSAQGIIDSVIEASGGQETFNSVFDALQEKPLALRQKIDGLLNDPDTRQYGIDMMFREANVQRPNVTPAPAPAPKPAGQPNNAVPGTEVAAFKSFEEQVAAQRDPRYRTNAAYRAEVEQKIRGSTYTMNPRTHASGL